MDEAAKADEAKEAPPAPAADAEAPAAEPPRASVTSATVSKAPSKSASAATAPSAEEAPKSTEDAAKGAEDVPQRPASITKTTGGPAKIATPKPLAKKPTTAKKTPTSTKKPPSAGKDAQGDDSEWEELPDSPIPEERKKPRTKKRRSCVWRAKRKPTTPPNYTPCLHRCFKQDVPERETLATEDYVNLLAKPKRTWMEASQDSFACLKWLPLSQRTAELARPKKGYVRGLLDEMGEVLSPDMIKRLLKILQDEFDMTAEQAAEFLRTGNKPKPRYLNPYMRTAWMKSFAYDLSEIIAAFVETPIKIRYTSEIKHSSAVIYWKLKDLMINPDQRPPKGMKKKVLRLMLHISDKLAVWIGNVVKESGLEIMKELTQNEKEIVDTESNELNKDESAGEKKEEAVTRLVDKDRPRTVDERKAKVAEGRKRPKTVEKEKKVKAGETTKVLPDKQKKCKKETKEAREKKVKKVKMVGEKAEAQEIRNIVGAVKQVDPGDAGKKSKKEKENEQEKNNRKTQEDLKKKSAEKDGVTQLESCKNSNHVEIRPREENVEQDLECARGVQQLEASVSVSEKGVVPAVSEAGGKAPKVAEKKTAVSRSEIEALAPEVVAGPEDDIPDVIVYSTILKLMTQLLDVEPPEEASVKRKKMARTLKSNFEPIIVLSASNGIDDEMRQMVNAFVDKLAYWMEGIVDNAASDMYEEFSKIDTIALDADSVTNIYAGTDYNAVVNADAGGDANAGGKVIAVSKVSAGETTNAGGIADAGGKANAAGKLNAVSKANAGGKAIPVSKVSAGETTNAGGKANVGGKGNAAGKPNAVSKANAGGKANTGSKDNAGGKTNAGGKDNAGENTNADGNSDGLSAAPSTDVQQWTGWMMETLSVAEDWASWISQTVADAADVAFEKRIQLAPNDSLVPMTRGEWLAWKESTARGVQEWVKRNELLLKAAASWTRKAGERPAVTCANRHKADQQPG